jgi:hypothetical protein
MNPRIIDIAILEASLKQLSRIRHRGLIYLRFHRFARLRMIVVRDYRSHVAHGEHTRSGRQLSGILCAHATVDYRQHGGEGFYLQFARLLA